MCLLIFWPVFTFSVLTLLRPRPLLTIYSIYFFSAFGSEWAIFSNLEFSSFGWETDIFSRQAKQIRHLAGIYYFRQKAEIFSSKSSPTVTICCQVPAKAIVLSVSQGKGQTRLVNFGMDSSESWSSNVIKKFREEWVMNASYLPTTSCRFFSHSSCSTFSWAQSNARLLNTLSGNLVKKPPFDFFISWQDMYLNYSNTLSPSPCLPRLLILQGREPPVQELTPQLSILHCAQSHAWRRQCWWRQQWMRRWGRQPRRPSQWRRGRRGRGSLPRAKRRRRGSRGAGVWRLMPTAFWEFFVWCIAWTGERGAFYTCLYSFPYLFKRYGGRVSTRGCEMLCHLKELIVWNLIEMLLCYTKSQLEYILQNLLMNVMMSFLSIQTMS